jgi:hypothetical protein
MRAEQRYRTQIEFLVSRFRPEGAFGLSFTIGLAALTVSVWIFGGVLQDVLAHEEVALFDAPIVSYIASHRLSWVTAGMEVITYTGGEVFLAAVVGASGLALRYRTGSWRPLLLLTAAVLRGDVAGFGGKARDRSAASGCRMDGGAYHGLCVSIRPFDRINGHLRCSGLSGSAGSDGLASEGRIVPYWSARASDPMPRSSILLGLGHRNCRWHK